MAKTPKECSTLSVSTKFGFQWWISWEFFLRPLPTLTVTSLGSHNQWRVWEINVRSHKLWKSCLFGVFIYTKKLKKLFWKINLKRSVKSPIGNKVDSECCWHPERKTGKVKNIFSSWVQKYNPQYSIHHFLNKPEQSTLLSNIHMLTRTWHVTTAEALLAGAMFFLKHSVQIYQLNFQ